MKPLESTQHCFLLYLTTLGYILDIQCCEMCVLIAVSGKAVSWMKGLDDDVWVWVMGEHSDDKTYDQICDEIMAERAAVQAQIEAEKLR